MRVLVTGVSSLLGRSLIFELTRKGREVIAVSRSGKVGLEHEGLKVVRLDLADRIGIEDLVLRTKPEAVVHAAAYTDVDGCERDRARAWRVNVEATRRIVMAARAVKPYVVSVSIVTGDTPVLVKVGSKAEPVPRVQGDLHYTIFHPTDGIRQHHQAHRREDG